MINATFWDPALGLVIEPILCFCLIKLEQFLPFLGGGMYWPEWTSGVLVN